MKVRTPRRWPGDLPPFAPLGPTDAHAIKDAPVEQQRVLKRLHELIEMHQVSAARMDVALGAEDVLIVIDALEAEAEAEKIDPLQVLACPDEVRQYARFSLYDEMLDEPSNILLATPVSADTTRYEAMPRSFWVDCLRALRAVWKGEEATPGAATATEDTEETAVPPETEESA